MFCFLVVCLCVCIHVCACVGVGGGWVLFVFIYLMYEPVSVPACIDYVGDIDTSQCVRVFSPWWSWSISYQNYSGTGITQIETCVQEQIYFICPQNPVCCHKDGPCCCLSPFLSSDCLPRTHNKVPLIHERTITLLIDS